MGLQIRHAVDAGAPLSSSQTRQSKSQPSQSHAFMAAEREMIDNSIRWTGIHQSKARLRSHCAWAPEELQKSQQQWFEELKRHLGLKSMWVNKKHVEAMVYKLTIGKGFIHPTSQQNTDAMLRNHRSPATCTSYCSCHFLRRPRTRIAPHAAPWRAAGGTPAFGGTVQKMRLRLEATLSFWLTMPANWEDLSLYQPLFDRKPRRTLPFAWS